MIKYLLAFLFLASSVSGQVLPDTPKPKVHKFFDKPAKIEFVTWGLVGGADVGQTCYNLNHGGREVLVPTQSCRGILAYSALAVGVVVGTKYLLHKTGHHKIEQFVLPVAIAGNSAGLISSKVNGAF